MLNIYLRTTNAPRDHVVVTNNVGNTISIIFEGSRSQCETHISRRARVGMATHFCHVCKDTPRAIKMLKKRLGI